VIRKVTDPTKIVTDGVVLRELARQGIDKGYVEFCQDYAPRSLGKEHSPYAKFYRDLKSGKQFMVVSGLPMVKPDGSKVEVGWLLVEGKYYSKANLFSSIVEGTRVKLTCLSDQPYGAKKNEQTTWNPQLFVDGVEQKPINGQPALLDIDPINENYHDNVLEWDYGICKRRIRIIEGSFYERWIFPSNPNGDILIKHNFSGDYKPRLGIYMVNDDEEFIPASVFDKAVYPFEIGATDTFYSTGDTYLSNREATTNYGAEDHLYVGDGSGGGDSQCRDLVKFDISTIPSNAIVSAVTFSLYEYAAGDTAGVGDHAVEMNRLLLNWVEDEATWNIYSTGNNWNTAGCSGSNSDYDSDISATLTLDSTAESDYVDWTGATLIDDVQKVVDEIYTNYGWRVASPTAETQGTNYCYNSFYSLNKGTGYKPKLVVTYTVITEKSSSDTGSGAESLDSKLSSAAETGSGAESLGSRLFGAAETGSGTGASSLLAALTGTEETGLGSEFAAKIFSTFDSGSGIDAVIARLLAATETGSSVEVALLITTLISSDGGVGSDLSTLLKAILAADAGSGVEALKALIETAGSDMRLRARPGQVRIPSKGVNL